MAAPLQIVSIGDNDSDNFALSSENLSSILKKIPEGTKVAVVSVVGAFRTGKSFLLNFFLRYLRCNVSGDLSEDWMTIDGAELCEGNMNERGTSSSETESANSFAWRGGQERQTTGIWMWSEPFLRTPKGSSEQVAVLLMDTQGMFDNETSMSLTAQIFGLSTFVSSFQIYNVERRIQEDNLQHLALFAEYGRMAAAPNKQQSFVSSANDTENKTQKAGDEVIEVEQILLEEVRAAVEGGIEKDISSTENGREVRTKPFQHLQFLVRDWSNFDADWDDESIGKDEEDEEVDELVMVGQQKKKQEIKTDNKDAVYSKLRGEMKVYMKDVIKDRGLGDLQSTREQISRCFGAVDCFLLPHPGLAVTKKNFSGSIPQIGSFFRGMINRYVRLIFDEQLEAKVIHRRAITAPELMTYFEVYVKMFQAGNKSFPKAMTMLDATTEASNRNAQDLALAMYKSHMSIIMQGSAGRTPFMKEDLLEVLHKGAMKKALEEFESIATMGSDGSVKNARNILIEKIDAEKVRNFELNAMRNPFKDLEMYAIPVAVASLGWMMATVTDVTCSHHVCEVAEDSFEKLYMFGAFILLCLALRHPFTDVIMYTAPLFVAAVAWLSATVIDVSCSTEACQKTEGALKKLYLYILLCMAVLAWRNFSGSFAHLKELWLPIISKAVAAENKKTE